MAKRDWFTEAFGHAVGDVRNRWEEFAYGRALTPDFPHPPHTDDRDHSMAQRSGWDIPGERTPDMDRANHTHDFDLDR